MPNGEIRCQPNIFNIPDGFSEIFLYKFDETHNQLNLPKTPDMQDKACS